MDKEGLQNEIEIELGNLERLCKEMDELINKFVNKTDFI